jgi:hypothetical protein
MRPVMIINLFNGSFVKMIFELENVDFTIAKGGGYFW